MQRTHIALRHADQDVGVRAAVETVLLAPAKDHVAAVASRR